MNPGYDLLVNKTHRLNASDRPSDLVYSPVPFDAPQKDSKRLLRKKAANAAKALFHAGKQYQFYGISGFRSFERQEEIFEESIKRAGLAHTEQYIAPPGGSEHQTGLALDVSTPEFHFDLVPEFGNCEAGIWLKKNAPLFGFILRYPEHKESITGYACEPWHIRYVTRQLALYLSKTGLVLEEYYSLRSMPN